MKSWELDRANPGFAEKDYRSHGLALRADYKMREGESADEYWARVLVEITQRVA